MEDERRKVIDFEMCFYSQLHVLFKYSPRTYRYTSNFLSLN